MKVVHLVTVNKGGAYRAADRINRALSQCVSSMVITSKDVHINKLSVLVRKVWHKVCLHFPLGTQRTEYYFNNDLETMPIKKMHQIKDADIIHLHWIADGMINLSSYKKLTEMGKPIVWTLHDMHAFTGGCHYSDGCEKYKSQCNECNQIDSRKKHDFTTWNQARKKKGHKNANMAVVGCSRWITECARSSAIMNGKQCTTIANCIETEVYKPCEKSYARDRLAVDFGNKKVIAFGAMNSTTDKRKGYQYLKQVLMKLDSDRYACFILGEKVEKIEGMQIHTIDYLNDDYSLALFYAAADVFVAPSLEENLANTVMEALSCGTPVVAFDIGGMPDMIKKGYNGYLAQPFDVDDLAKGICECCENDELGKNARAYVLEHYNFNRIAEEYMDVYKLLLGEVEKKNEEF